MRIHNIKGGMVTTWLLYIIIKHDYVVVFDFIIFPSMGQLYNAISI